MNHSLPLDKFLRLSLLFLPRSATKCTPLLLIFCAFVLRDVAPLRIWYHESVWYLLPLREIPFFYIHGIQVFGGIHYSVCRFHPIEFHCTRFLNVPSLCGLLLHSQFRAFSFELETYDTVNRPLIYRPWSSSSIWSGEHGPWALVFDCCSNDRIIQMTAVYWLPAIWCSSNNDQNRMHDSFAIVIRACSHAPRTPAPKRICPSLRLEV